MTGELLASGAVLLATGAGRQAGVIGPVEAFGIDTFTDECAGLGLRRTTQ